MNKIYLIRHGKTIANLNHLYCGSSDLPLCPTGIQELHALHYSLKPKELITSGMIRTNQTAEILFPGVDYITESGFCEVNFGDFELKSYEELKDLPSYQKWISGNNEANVPPNGESGIEMTDRVLNTFSHYSSKPYDQVIITHGGVIAAIMESLFPDEKKNRYQWQPAPGHGYFLENDNYKLLDTI